MAFSECLLCVVYIYSYRCLVDVLHCSLVAYPMSYIIIAALSLFYVVMLYLCLSYIVIVFINLSLDSTVVFFETPCKLCRSQS